MFGSLITYHQHWTSETTQQIRQPSASSPPLNNEFNIKSFPKIIPFQHCLEITKLWNPRNKRLWLMIHAAWAEKASSLMIFWWAGEESASWLLWIIQPPCDHWHLRGVLLPGAVRSPISLTCCEGENSLRGPKLRFWQKRDEHWRADLDDRRRLWEVQKSMGQ